MESKHLPLSSASPPPVTHYPLSSLRLWRDLDEHAGHFETVPHRSSDARLDIPEDPTVFGRREFLEMMGAAAVVGGLSGCDFSQPRETIAPYAHQPESLVPGRPQFFATAIHEGGRTTGILVESHMGRPTKVEGNPDHPASLGATDAIAQAAPLSLYDPDRSQAVRRLGEISTWEAYLTDLRDALQQQEGQQGAGLRILTETVVSPTLHRQLRQILERFPKARWHQYEAGHPDTSLRASEKLFGRPLDAVYRFEKADVVVSLDCDFLATLDGSPRYTRDFMSRRDLTGGGKAMNRLYVAECGVSNTGAAADHRLPVHPAVMAALVRKLAQEIGVESLPAESRIAALPEGAAKWLAAVIADLKGAAGKSLVVVGPAQPWPVHALVHLINAKLENVGQTLDLIEPVALAPVHHIESIRELTRSMAAGEVDVLLIAGGNPAYTAPADLEFAKHIRAIERLAVHLGPYEDETSLQCHWHIPQTHFLESWSDVRAYDHTVTIQQPLIAPLFAGRSPHEFLSAVAGTETVPAYEAVRATWKEQRSDDFEAVWKKSVHDGLIAGTETKPVSTTASPAAEVIEELGRFGTGAIASPPPLAVVFAPDPTILDGRFANNGWLQELPKPWTRLTWDNAALMSAATAERLGVTKGNFVELQVGERSLSVPVWIVPGQPAEVVTLHFGYGRKVGGRIATAHGFDAFSLRTSNEPSIALSPKATAAGGRHKFACTQKTTSLEGRDEAIFRTLTLDVLANGLPVVSGHGAGHDAAHLPTLLPDWNYPDRAWGMSIDLTRCSGCSACVLACQVENNIPVVGKPGVLMGREMHWLRIDEYFAGDPENPQVLQQPMMCQHCEHAPCESVCPVAATTHSSEGLNEMTYNRCVGTRYCSNNCPYKVRRFNFLRYSEDGDPLAMLRANPDVTVRSRGVMEKCTYCVQRINAARIEASIESAHTGEPLQIADGAIVTACQAACPARAIVFGDINDKGSAVSKWREIPQKYGVLEELGTRPRTTYLPRVTNPSPLLAAAGHSEGGQPHEH
ncbi:4Fe-4S dicluster domain-containing protein [Planctomyces sp. SH-PL14]|uniref:4Fe-4S dicluster domain-containing protein n=1 Tax=Planctomyces sp. SH-PL14 TaxID=1632864 RepID=UPI00078D530B|nr:4Fe-4S dicluster domain-containing protein [Planctomyces sp. SH-PL14]AMV20119.1 Tetrathionate reductase subunit B precursor [Planctomyces sp. SH-PL14]